MRLANKKIIKKHMTNEQLAKAFIKKNDYTDNVFIRKGMKKLNASDFLYENYIEAIKCGILQGDGELNSGKANGIMSIYSPSLSRRKYFKAIESAKKGKKNEKVGFKTIRKKRIITAGNILDINVYGFNHVLFSTNLYYGGKARLKSLAYICNIDIDFDDVCTIKMWTKLLRLIEENVILRPTILVNSGTGAHLIYRLKVPIYCYNKAEIKEVMKLIKEAICNKLCKVYDFKQDFKEKIQPLSIDQKIRAIDTETKIAEFAESKEEKEKYLCRAWLIGESWDINHLITYAKKEIEKNMYRYYFIAYEKDNTIDKKTMIDGFKATMDFLVSSVKVVKNAKTYSSGKKHYRSCNSNLYYSWLKRCEEVQMGHRYYAILGLCSYAKKCKILYEELETDALKLMDYYQKRDGKETFTIFDVQQALSSFDSDYIMFSKGTTIASRAGLEIKGNKKRNGRTREEHIKIMCKHNGRKSKKEEVFKKLKDLEKTKDVKNMSLRELEVAIGVSKSTIARHIKEYYAI